MTDESHEIHEEAPTDEEGHPVHPERGHRICGARKSDRTTPTDHGRERDEYAYCLQAAGWGTDSDVGACRDHPYKGSQIGESNPNHEHGAYSEFEDFMYGSLTDRERDAVDALDLDEDGDEFAKDVVKEAYAKYLRTGDDRFLREARQWASEFGVVETPADKHEVEHSGEVDTELSVPDHVAEAIASNAESNLKDGERS